MRQSKEIADIISYFLRTNNVRYISTKDIQDIADVSVQEILKMDKVISILKFSGAIAFNKDFLLWENNYYKEI